MTSTAPVAVFSGHECAQVPNGIVACDTLLEQMIPVNNLSTDYLLTASKGAELSQTKTDVVRVVAATPGTVVTRDGVIVATLVNAGDVHEFQLAQNTGTRVQTSAPALVAQYLTGTGNSGGATDPAMSLRTRQRHLPQVLSPLDTDGCGGIRRVLPVDRDCHRRPG